MAKKRLTTKDVLDKMDDGTKVIVTAYAYGIYYARTYEDEIFTAADCKEKLRHDIMNGTVTSIYLTKANEDGKDVPYIGVNVEMVY